MLGRPAQIAGKHHGRHIAAMSDAGELSDGELLRLLIDADDEGLAAGQEPRRRDFENVRRVMNQLHPGAGYVLAGKLTPPLVRRVQRLNRRLYRPEDIRTGGVHMGAFMFRDLFARLSIPVIFGEVNLDPLEHIDLSDFQKEWLQHSPAEYARLGDQFIDLMDFGYGVMEMGHSRDIGDQAHTLLGLARFHFQAAGATMTGAYDLGGAVQSALLATELTLKAGLAANGVSEDRLKQEFGHDFGKAAKALGQFEVAFDTDRVLRVLETYPAYVPNRYAGEQPGRIQAGHLVMGAQYVAAEVTRQLTDRNLRRDGGMDQPRSYPE